MARDFYPFVEGTDGDGESDRGAGDACRVQHPARIAVYDDASAAPRVVMVEPKDVRSYLEEITSTVNRLSHEQGGTIPFMVIREVVENFIHAYFQAPTITILDGGQTIRFSDQGPGIKEKSRALEYGTSSATEEMRRYIRGVGSGLPYVQQYMEDKGGSLDIEDNIAGGTVVTISTRPQDEARALSGAEGAPGGAYAAPAGSGAGQLPGYGTPAGIPAQPAGIPGQPGAWPPGAAWGAAQPWGSPQPQAYPVPGAAGYPQPGYAALYPAGYQPGYPQPQAATAAPGSFSPQIQLDERAHQVVAYLAAHGAGGPTDLSQAYGTSAATWSRKLSELAAQGIVIKSGQKYQLTAIGATFA